MDAHASGSQRTTSASKDRPRADAVLPGRERRRRKVEDDVSAGARELVDRVVMVAAPLPEIAVVPDILADADADAASGDVEELRPVKRLEVAVFVEDVVGRQQRLAEALLDAPSAEQCGAVEERPALIGWVALGKADENGRQIDGVPRERLERVPASGDEAVAQQQIARQIANQRQLRRGGEVDAGGRRLSKRLEDQTRIALQIADGGIQLQQRDLHVV